MEDIHEDILCFAMSRYLIANELTPYDAVVENSAPENQSNPSDDWVPILMSLMTGMQNAFKRDELITADPVKNPLLFEEQSYSLHERSIRVAAAGGMLCQKWLCEKLVPYCDNRYLDESIEFIENAMLNFP